MNGDFLGFARRVPLFRTLTDQDLEDLQPGIRYRRLDDTTFLYRPGDPPDGMYVVEGGLLEVVAPARGNIEVRLAETGPGTVVGELALIDDRPRVQAVRARELSYVYCLERDYFMALREQYDPMAFKLMRAVAIKACGRLRDTSEGYARMIDDEYEALDPGTYSTKDKRSMFSKLFGGKGR
jgi:CRP-like cAMP-binding protein